MADSKQKRILITGANGFIGGALMRHFEANDISPIGIDLVGVGDNILAEDISKPETFSAALDECDVLIHSAALVSNAASDPDMWKANVLATKRLAEAAVKYRVRRFIHISSIVVYGNTAVGELDETHPVHGNGGSYVLTKLAAEHAVLASAINSSMETVIIRPGDVYGPGSRPWVVLPIEAIKKNQFILPAYGRGYFRPIYIDDLVTGISLAASKESAANEIFNMSCKGYILTKEFFSHHFKWMDKRGPVSVPTPIALLCASAATKIAKLSGEVSEASRATMMQLCTKSWFNISKAEHLLGWRPEMSLDEGMNLSRSWALQKGLLD
jgi:nucleoside-diphosphate-sugar epimerase